MRCRDRAEGVLMKDIETRVMELQVTGDQRLLETSRSLEETMKDSSPEALSRLCPLTPSPQSSYPKIER